MPGLNDQEFLRYNRHVMVDKVGEAGQIKLKNAHVLIVGMGGLGCPASQYLVASGVGRLTLIDHDHIELSNLQRQVLYRHQDIGQSKVQVAKAQLEALNPLVTIKALPRSIFDVDLPSLLQSVDLVLDCTDNPKTRHFINKACIKAQVKLVSASAIQGQGQMISFDFSDSNAPCYACLFPEADAAPQTCSTSGVLSPLLGIMGSLQASEAVKLLLGQTTSLNSMTSVDAWGLSFKQMKVSKNKHCGSCH